MKKPPRKTSLLDQALFLALTRGWKHEHIGDYLTKLKRQDAMLANAATNSLHNVDTKAAGLLQHVAMMMAGLGLVAPLIAHSDIEIALVLIEIGLYLLIAIGCLRCLSIFQAKHLDAYRADMRDIINRELIVRRELYDVCNKAAIILTVAVFLSLPFLFFYTPERTP